MALSLKISNIIYNEENAAELLKRLKGMKTPGIAKLKLALLSVQSESLSSEEKDVYWKQIAEELLYRFELYSSLRVMNYTKADVNLIITQMFKVGAAKVLQALMEECSRARQYAA